MYGWDTVEKQHVVDLLTALKEFFSDKDKWIYWPRGEDKTGKEVEPSSEDAVMWCLSGAGQVLASKMFDVPLCDYVECATREVLDEMSDGKHAHGMTYDDEYALICLVLEQLTKEEEAK